MAIESEVTVTPKRRRRFFLLVPPSVLTSFSYALAGTVITDLMVYRTCLVTLKINGTECLMLRNNADNPAAMDLEMKVEPYASVVVMANALIKNILPALLSLFLGFWSDRVGRRTLFLTAISGTTLMYVILYLMCNWDISPWYLLLASVPANMVGAMHAAKLAFVCHITDTTSEKNRIGQITLLEGSLCSGALLGQIAAPFIYQNHRYSHIFATSAICCILAVAYTYFFIPETVKNTSKGPITGLFKISILKEFVTTCSAKREGFSRRIVWLSISATALNAMILKGDAIINFLFTRARLGWDVQDYSYFDATEGLLHITGLCLVALRSRIPGATDTLFAFVSFLSALGRAIAKSLAWKSWHMYLSAFIGIFSGITIPVMRSIISKFVPAQDVTKVFALTESLEIIIALGGPALYTLIYTHYLPPIYPAPVYLLAVGVLMISLICVLGVEILIRNRRAPPTYIPAAVEEDLSSQ